LRYRPGTVVVSPSPLTQETLALAVRELAAGDPDLSAIVERSGPPPMWGRPAGFPTLVHIVLEQQVSLASAQAACDRLRSAVDALTPDRFLELDDARLLAIGFSRQKARCVRGVARAVASGTLDLEGLALLADEDVHRATISMAFNPASIPANGTSTLTFTLNNPETNSNDLDGLGFTDTLPAGLSVADSSTSVCNGGTLTTSGGNTISLSGASLPVSWMCSFSVLVSGPAAGGTYTNKTGSLTSTRGIPGKAATASLVVAAPNTTSPPTSTGRSDAPGRSDPRMPMFLLLAFVAGFVAVRRAGIRGHNPVQG
jgi:hypothetical protein